MGRNRLDRARGGFDVPDLSQWQSHAWARPLALRGSLVWRRPRLWGNKNHSREHVPAGWRLPRPSRRHRVRGDSTRLHTRAPRARQRWPTTQAVPAPTGPGDEPRQPQSCMALAPAYAPMHVEGPCTDQLGRAVPGRAHKGVLADQGPVNPMNLLGVLGVALHKLVLWWLFWPWSWADERRRQSPNAARCAPALLGPQSKMTSM